MSAEQELDCLAYVDEAESNRYDSRAVFSEVGLGVEVEEYESFTMYRWEGDVDFEDVLESVQPHFPFVEDPALELISEKDEALRYRSERDHETMDNDSVYDPVREWRGEDRWSDYELIQINLNGAKVVWDDKQALNQLRIYEIDEEADAFEQLFTEIMESSKAERVAEDISSFEIQN